MPPLSPERWRVVGPLLDRALDLTPEERGPWLERLRAGDAGDAVLAEQVEALLDDHAALSAEGFLADEPVALPERTSLAGLTVGVYTLRTLLGQGGMGQVWLADRSDGRFEGVAAVKLLNASLIGREGEARFRQEGNLLARLRHPSIAHIIDAGVTSMGQPYLVLEYVDGEPIDGHCDARRLGIEARIRLFLEVISAVAFAHAHLVVHRDLKPPNIFVGKDGRVRLLDFGIAKLLDPDGGHGAAAVTREGESVLTPEYASPEQLTRGPISTATDVYALGVVLYLLLTGQHPAGPDISSPAELIKAIVDREVPRPSDVVVTSATGRPEPLEEHAARRGDGPRRLRRRLRGDLDNIVARALRKDPGDRYPSVESMAADLRRHLDSEPVSARAESLVYRAAKFVRRNRAGVAAAGLVLAAILAGTAGVAWQAREARAQRDAAEAQFVRAAAANDLITHLLSVAAPSGKKFTVGELLDQGEALIDKQFAGDDGMRAEMLVVIGWEYVMSEHWDRAALLLERAAEIAQRSADPALRARAHCPLSYLKFMRGERDEAKTMLDQALAELPDAPQYDLQRADCMMRRAAFGYYDSNGREMIRNSTEAIGLLGRARAATGTKKTDALGHLAYGYYLDGQNAKAEETFAQVMKELEQMGRGHTVAAADTLNNWSLVYFQGNVAKAEPLCRRMVELRRAIEGSDAIAPTNTFNLAGVLIELGRHDEAEALLEETVRTAQARGEHRIQFDAMMELAGIHIETGDLPGAAAQLDKLLPFTGHPQFNIFRQALLACYRGRLAQARGDEAAARSQYTLAIELYEKRTAKIAMNVRALIGLARAELALLDVAAAAAAADRALVLAESFVEKGSPSYLIGLSLAVRGEILFARGNPDEARATFRTASGHLEQTLGSGHPATKEALRRATS